MGSTHSLWVALVCGCVWLQGAPALGQELVDGMAPISEEVGAYRPLVDGARRIVREEKRVLELAWDGKAFRSGGSFRAGALRTVRFQQEVGGLPLLGGLVSVALDEAGGLVHVHDRSRDSFELASGVRIPGAPWAIDRALALVGSPVLRAAGRATLLAWPGSPCRPAYLVDLPLSPAPTTLAVVVDARDGSLIDWSRRDVQRFRARVFETNPVASSLVDVQLPHLPEDAEILEGRFARVARCRLREGECRPAHEAGADGEGDFLFEPEDGNGEERDPFAEVSAYHHVNRIRTLFSSLGFAEEQLLGLRVWVNVPGVNNAAFSPLEPMLIFGQGGRDYAYDGDVVYHEYTHAVVDRSAGLLPVFTSPGLSHMPGALNEGIADQFSTAVSDDPRLGEYAGGYARWGEGEVRDMIGAARCPDDQIGEVHKDGVPWSQVMWELRELLGPERYLELAWAGLTMLAPTDGPADAAELFLSLLAERGDAVEQAAAEESVERHGLAECQPVLPLDWRRPRGAVNFSATALSDGQLDMEFPAYLQHRFEVPEGTTELTITKRLLGCSGCEHSIILRHGEPVSFRMSGVVVPRLEIEADRVVEDQRSATLVEPAPGSWFVASTNRGLQTFYFSTSYDLWPRPEGPGSSGDGGALDGGGGGDAQGLDAGVDARSPDEGESPASSPGSAQGCACDVGSMGRPYKARQAQLVTGGWTLLHRALLAGR